MVSSADQVLRFTELSCPSFTHIYLSIYAAISIIVISVLLFFTNSFAIFIFRRCSFRSLLANHLIVTLSIVDCFSVVLVNLPFAASAFLNKSIANVTDLSCRLLPYIQLICTGAQSLMIAAIVLERFISAFTYINKKVYFGILFALFGIICAAYVPIIAYSDFSTSNNHSFCLLMNYYQFQYGIRWFHISLELVLPVVTVLLFFVSICVSPCLFDMHYKTPANKWSALLCLCCVLAYLIFHTPVVILRLLLQLKVPTLLPEAYATPTTSCILHLGLFTVSLIRPLLQPILYLLVPRCGRDCCLILCRTRGSKTLQPQDSVMVTRSRYAIR